jgi:hypothetical protein
MANEHGYRNVLFEDIAKMVAISTAAQLAEYEKEQKALEANPDALGTKKPKSVASVPVVPRNR